MEKNCIMGSFRICTFYPIKYRVIKSRNVRLAGYMTYMGEKKIVYVF